MVKHLPWLELQIVRNVVKHPGHLRFKNLLGLLSSEWEQDEIADAVCYLVHVGLIRLGKTGFTAFN